MFMPRHYQTNEYNCYRSTYSGYFYNSYYIKQNVYVPFSFEYGYGI